VEEEEGLQLRHAATVVGCGDSALPQPWMTRLSEVVEEEEDRQLRHTATVVGCGGRPNLTRCLQPWVSRLPGICTTVCEEALRGSTGKSRAPSPPITLGLRFPE